MKLPTPSRWLIAGLLLSSTQARAALDEVLPSASSEIVTRTIGTRHVRVRTRDNVREFAGDDGRVFAIAWRTPFAPRLLPLLGTHADAYLREARLHRGNHGHLSFRTDELGVSVLRHARINEGKVWLARKLPEGVTLDAIR